MSYRERDFEGQRFARLRPEEERILLRRFALLQYTLNDQGSVVDSSGNTIVDALDTSNTGMTPNELAALGYSPDQIAQLAGSTAGVTSGTPTPPNVSGGLTAGSPGTGGFLSGLGSLFGTVGTAITNTTRSLQNPAINPQTGIRYGLNPATGLPVSQVQQNSVLWIVALAVIAFFIMRK